MTDEELAYLSKYFRRLLIAAETKEESGLMWLMIRVGVVDYPPSRALERFGGGFLLCEMCVPDAPFPSTCVKTCLKLYDFADANPPYPYDPGAGPVGYLGQMVGAVSSLSPNEAFDAEAYRATGIRKDHRENGLIAMRSLRAKLDANSNILLTSVLAHRLDLICHCPFGLRPRY